MLFIKRTNRVIWGRSLDSAAINSTRAEGGSCYRLWAQMPWQFLVVTLFLPLGHALFATFLVVQRRFSLLFPDFWFSTVRVV